MQWATDRGARTCIHCDQERADRKHTAGIGRPSDKLGSTPGFPAALLVHSQGAAVSRYYPAVSRKSFWFNKPWPRDAPDGSHLFLGNAVLAAGRAIFGADWSDEDPQAAFSHKDSVAEERARVTEVMERLGIAIARGDVGFALRPEKGGDFKPQREAVDPRASALIAFGRANWNVDDFTPLFKFAQMNDGKYRVEQVPPLDWIYVERRTFEHFIVGLSSRTLEVGVNVTDPEPSPTPNADPRPQCINSIDTTDLPDFRDEREHLIDAVESGRMLLFVAEKLAAEKGLQPIKIDPDPADFAVLEMASWSIEMVVAWIIWRDPDEVAKFHHEFHRRWTIYSSNFDSFPELSLAGVRGYFESQSNIVSSVETFNSATSLLANALESGAVKSRVLNLKTLADGDIEPGKWRYLSLVNGGAKPSQFTDPSGTRFGNITFSSQAVVEAWPAQKTGEAQTLEPDANGTTKKGRPPKYDWPAFHAEVIRKLDEEGDFDVAIDPGWTQSALERHMAEWCERKWRGSAQPGESTIRREVSNTRKRFIETRRGSKGS
ncbi:hypothetical protein ACC732_28535 [Rhizobium ruizarguesonis]